jgi:uncharacterized Zn-binding protein involved in type VI secretion
MSNGVVRKTDVNAAGGAVTSNQVTSVRVNSLPITVEGDSGTPDSACDGDIHCSWTTVATNPKTVRAGGVPINIKTDIDTCGHPRQSASSNVRAY